MIEDPVLVFNGVNSNFSRSDVQLFEGAKQSNLVQILQGADSLSRSGQAAAGGGAGAWWGGHEAKQCQPVHTGVESSPPQRGTRPIKWASILTVTPTFLLLSCQAKCVFTYQNTQIADRGRYFRRDFHLMTDSITPRLKHGADCCFVTES